VLTDTENANVVCDINRGTGASRVVVLGLLLAGLTAIVTAQTAGYAAPQEFLRRGLKFSEQDLAAVVRGRPAARTLPSDDRSVAAAGLVRVRTTPQDLVERLRDIGGFKTDAAVLQIGRFSPTPRLEDLDALIWEADDLRAFRTCRVGACDVRLPADAIARVRAIDWSAPHSDLEASRVARRLLVEMAQAYMARGDRTLDDYRDRERPVNPRREFQQVAAATPSAFDLSPEFRDYLLAFPQQSLDGVENFLYWSKEKIAFHAVVSVTHVAMYQPSAPKAFGLMVASRQVYASRYFDASLGATVMFPATRPGDREPSFDLLYVNRSRTDELDGFWGGLKRKIVRSKARGAMQKYLGLLKGRLERRPTDGAPLPVAPVTAGPATRSASRRHRRPLRRFRRRGALVA
jgi:hypothetical protein